MMDPRTNMLASLAACTTTKVEQWESVPERVVDQAYVKLAADFSIYRRLLPEPFEIYYPDEIGDPDPDDIARIREIFREAFVAAVGDDYEIVREPGPDVLKVRASLVDLRIKKPYAPVNVGRRLAGIVNAGHLTFLMEMIDSRSGETLARAADEEKPDSVSTDSADDNWMAVEAAAKRWAGLFSIFFDNYLDQS